MIDPRLLEVSGFLRRQEAPVRDRLVGFSLGKAYMNLRILISMHICYSTPRVAQLFKVVDFMHEALLNDVPTTKRYVTL